MEKAEEMLLECNSIRDIINAMKLYANQKLDEASEKATVKSIPNIDGGYLKMVDKQSILNLKDKI